MRTTMRSERLYPSVPRLAADALELIWYRRRFLQPSLPDQDGVQVTVYARPRLEFTCRQISRRRRGKLCGCFGPAPDRVVVETEARLGEGFGQLSTDHLRHRIGHSRVATAHATD